LLNVIDPEALVASVSVVHVAWSSSVAVWGAESLFVQVMVSPTLAVTDAGENAKFAIFTATVPAACATAHPPPAAADGAALDGASLDGASLDGASLDGASDAGAADTGARDGAVVAVLPPLQAATRNIAPNRNVPRTLVRDMIASTLLARSCLGCIDGYVGIERPVSSKAA
jgi:hypothetical protein